MYIFSVLYFIAHYFVHIILCSVKKKKKDSFKTRDNTGMGGGFEMAFNGDRMECVGGDGVGGVCIGVMGLAEEAARCG